MASWKPQAIPMTSRLNHRTLIVAVVFSLVGLAALAISRMVLPPPNLNQIHALARVRQFKQAQTLLDRHLQAYPTDEQAHLLMAQLMTEPTNAHPEPALDHLRAIRPKTPKQAALIQFFQGKAHYQQGRYDLAEACWTEALRLDPVVPEAGWVLVDLLDKESRTEEAHRLGMRLHEVEPDRTRPSPDPARNVSARHRNAGPFVAGPAFRAFGQAAPRKPSTFRDPGAGADPCQSRRRGDSKSCMKP